jgi:acyl dehydratase
VQDFEVDTDHRYFEDYVPGTVVQYGPIEVDEAEMIAFARRYDPQPFHVDPVRAAQGPFGGLIASGWHTAAMTMRVLVDRYLSRAASLGSPGVDELRWLAPVRPGDRLTVRVTVAEARRSKTRPELGIVSSLIEVLNQDAALVMTLKGKTMTRARSAAPARDDGAAVAR